MNFNNLMQQAKMMQKKLDEFNKKEFEYDNLTKQAEDIDTLNFEGEAP